MTHTGQLETLRNLGPASARRLRAVGIADHADLVEVGPVKAYVRVQARFDHTSINLLWALFGALVDLDWRELPAAERTRLRDEAERARPSTAGSPGTA